jgi:hypothetical protein
MYHLAQQGILKNREHNYKFEFPNLPEHQATVVDLIFVLKTLKIINH